MSSTQDFHALSLMVVEVARQMLDEDRAHSPDRDPYEIVRSLSEGLSGDIAAAISIHLRVQLQREGLRPR